MLVNSKSPDQRGTIVDVPGNLVDMLADSIRNQFYILRQDKNQLLVFDGSNYTQVATFRTGNLPRAWRSHSIAAFFWWGTQGANW